MDPTSHAWRNWFPPYGIFGLAIGITILASVAMYLLLLATGKIGLTSLMAAMVIALAIYTLYYEGIYLSDYYKAANYWSTIASPLVLLANLAILYVLARRAFWKRRPATSGKVTPPATPPAHADSPPPQ